MKYLVSGYLTISVFKVVEAESEAAARRYAEESLSPPSLCHQCSSAGDGEGTWELNGFDDPPEDVVQSVEIEETS